MDELQNNNCSGNHKGLIITLSSVCGILLLAFIVFGVVVFFEMNNLKEKNRFLSEYIVDNSILDSEKIIVDTKPTNPSVDELSQLPEGPKLVKKTDDGEELVFLFRNDYDNVLMWDQWLFVAGNNYGKKGDVAKVKAYNIETGENKIIFDLNETEDFKGQVAQYVNNMDVIDGKLFISLGGYLMDGGVFYMDLTDEMDDEINFIGKVPNPAIHKVDQGYFVIGGEGDACWSKMEIYTVAKDLSSLGKVLEIEDMCGDGQQLIYRDGQRFIVGALEKEAEEAQYGVFTQVGVQELFESHGAGSLLNEDQMPAGIGQIKGFEDRMFLVGDWLYEYTYATDKLEKIVEMTEETEFKPWEKWGLYSFDKKKNTLCFNENYQLNLATKLVTKMADKCYPLTLDASPPKIEEKIEALDLPEQYYYKK
jgi:hypothetical protein